MARVMVLVHEEKGRFGASFPDFPGCTTVAASLSEVLDKAGQVLAFHLQGLLEDGAPVPQVRSPDEVWADPQVREDAGDATLASMLEIDLPGRSVRVNITLDELVLDVVDRAAAAAGESRSAYLARAALQRARADVGGRMERRKEAPPRKRRA